MSQNNAFDKEPSLEDILLSIRKILSESDEQSDGQTASDLDDDILELTLDMTYVPPPDTRSDLPPETPPETQAEVAPKASLPALPALRHAATGRVSLAKAVSGGKAVSGEPERLVSPDTEARAGDMLADLASTVVRERTASLGNPNLTIESMVREVLRELLRDWLDQNLPRITERLVQKEIERLVKRAENS